MNKIVKISKMLGKLVEVTLDNNKVYTAKEIFNLANIDIDNNYVINDGDSKITPDDIVYSSILLASIKVKGNLPIYVSKDTIEFDDFFKVPEAILNGKYTIISDTNKKVKLKDINTNINYSIEKNLFDSLFEEENNNINLTSNFKIQKYY